MITIYTNGNRDCEITKIFLKMRDYTFREIDVSKDITPIKRYIFRNLGRYSLPITDIDGRFVVMGLDIELTELLLEGVKGGEKK